MSSAKPRLGLRIGNWLEKNFPLIRKAIERDKQKGLMKNFDRLNEQGDDLDLNRRMNFGISAALFALLICVVSVDDRHISILIAILSIAFGLPASIMNAVWGEFDYSIRKANPKEKLGKSPQIFPLMSVSSLLIALSCVIFWLSPIALAIFTVSSGASLVIFFRLLCSCHRSGRRIFSFGF